MKKVKFYTYKSTVGRRAHEVSKAWKLGLHVFLNDEDLIFRVCYLRNKKGTHYIQGTVRVRERREACNR